MSRDRADTLFSNHILFTDFLGFRSHMEKNGTLIDSSYISNCGIGLEKNNILVPWTREEDLSISLSACLSICIFVYMSICLYMRNY